MCLLFCDGLRITIYNEWPRVRKRKVVGKRLAVFRVSNPIPEIPLFLRRFFSLLYKKQKKERCRRRALLLLPPLSSAARARSVLTTTSVTEIREERALVRAPVSPVDDRKETLEEEEEEKIDYRRRGSFSLLLVRT